MSERITDKELRDIVAISAHSSPEYRCAVEALARGERIAELERECERVKVTLTGEITDQIQRREKAEQSLGKWMNGFASQSDKLAAAEARLAIASDPRHVIPCESCGHAMEVPCELADKIAAAESALGTEKMVSNTLRGDVSALRADKERLDWLSHQPIHAVNYWAEGKYNEVGPLRKSIDKAMMAQSRSEAIDAARKGER